jgi:adenylosuccinate synthase
MKTTNEIVDIKAHICIGLGFGDEGKGITTDYLCSKSENQIVIRFSGGQQAGHTVIYNGVKHIHSNFGSGSLRNIPTYFSEHTVFYPVTIARELKVLRDKGINPKLTLHPLAKMTTPFDVFENRGDDENLANGTCGLGIGKTMKRNEWPFKLYAIDLLNKNILIEKLKSIKDNYYEEFKANKALNDEILDFMDAITNLSWDVQNYDYLKNYDELIFEGSQGIMLDMDHGIFPYVTFANTTSKNAHEILDKLNISNRNIYYITRCYSTRHGSGPFPEEKINLIKNEEEINTFNKYQKEFKTAKINYGLLNQALLIDSIYSDGKVTTKNLMVTCLDQIPNFEFDYDRLNVTFSSIYESRSPKSENILKKH